MASAAAATEETKVSVLCSLFDWILRTKTSAKKRQKVRKFLDNFCGGGDYFSAIRLLLPNLDRERGSYGLKESVLATSLVDALGMSRDSEDARRLINWRKGGASTGANAGNFALVASEVLQRRQGMASGGLTIKELNELLDRLASSENRAEKNSVLSTLINKTNAKEMKWIIMIILKDLKLGMSEKSIFQEFHPDAEDLFNVTCDLKLVCEKLRDRSQRHKRQDIEVGKAVRSQLAMRVSDASYAWKKLHGKEVVVECKFDGERIQIHKNGSEIHYFSRNFLDHSEYSYGMSDSIIHNVLTDRCILDGELLVWDKSLNRFADFGSIQETAKAEKDGFDSDRQLCYVAFDILYFGDTSVIHQSLKDRHELLKKVIKPLKGRLEILVPECGLNSRSSPGELCWSLIAHNVDGVERFFKATIENRDEGIVLKDLSSKWEPSDRSGKWMKLKPDYVRAGSDLDVLIIGGYYGSGRRGGEVAQFLVGLAERPAPNTYPRRFISFCRVGTGLSDEELDSVVNKLKPYFRKYEYPKKPPPSFYNVTDNSKERPDVWIDSPEKSIILSITSDIRTIRSEVFAAPYGLRFPRIDRVRYDKPWHECLDVEAFVELVRSSNGTTQRGTESGGVSKQQRVKSSTRKEKKNLSSVPSHLAQTDISGVKGDTLIFSDMMFYFVNVPSSHSLDSLHKMVAENGGTFSMNLNSSVTHCIAAESKGFKFQAAKRQGDVIHYSWVMDCCSEKMLLPLQPKYFLFLSDSSKKRLQEEVDEFSDSYYWDLELNDFKQLLSNVYRTEDGNIIDHYKKKYSPAKWSKFRGCSIYFGAAVQPLKPDWEAILGIALRRLKVEVCMNGGRVSSSLSQATHLVVLLIPGYPVDSVLNSFNARERNILRNGKLHIVQSEWLEDSAERKDRLPEETYSLKPMLDLMNTEDENHDMDLEVPSPSHHAENENSKSLLNEEEHRISSNSPKCPQNVATVNPSTLKKRGRPSVKSTNKRKVATIQPRRTRARIGSKPAKISGNESDNSASSKENSSKTEDEQVKESHERMDKKASSTRQRKSEPKQAQRAPKRVRKKPARISENESDHNVSNEETIVKEETGKAEVKNEKMDKDTSKIPETQISLRDSEPSDKGRQRVRKWFSRVPEMKTIEEKHSHETSEPLPSQKPEEVMTDPVQAMLLDMIPSLGKSKAQDTTTTTTTTTSSQERSQPVLQNPTESKKKKVSYKDLARQFLED